ncbi:glycosyltransferase family 4 protein [Bacteroides congonensis]|uniref:glycosyltransferase family 4 protein n=1 Tax=Bacteroides congonensis TaxID=1871006 RepID=UPI00267541D6|nr:glycosyltransferase family 4 protein [Bacteroides congonensis]
MADYNVKKKFFITTTIPMTLGFFKGQCKTLRDIYDVCAVSSPHKELMLFAQQEGIRYKVLKMERDISIFSDLCALFKWIWLLSVERPYVVHANTPKASLLAMVAAWLTFRPIRIYMCHGLRYQGCAGMKRRILMTMERISCFCANRVICVSNGVREQFAEDGICSLNKSKVIMYGSANGVDTEYFNPEIVDDLAVRTQYSIKDSDLVCVFIGRMVRDKGVEELVDVVAQLHNDGFPVKLLMVGGREEKLDALSERTEQLIKDAEYIIECGRQSDVRTFIKASKLLVLPSYREGFGQVLVEANSLGIPVIASRIIGCQNVVNERVNGLLCEPRDKVSLYNCMFSLFSDEKLYKSIKLECRQYTISHFDRKILINAYVQYYASLLQ